MPQLSPDGRRVAFTTNRSGDWEIWLADPDGSNALQLTFMGARAAVPRWSPDGDRIVFLSNFEGQWDVYMVPAAGGPVVGWILNQARSRAIDRLRFDQRKKRINTQPERPPMETPAGGPQEAFAVKEQSQLLRQALQGLSPDERQALETAFFSELTYAEVAAELKQPLGTVKTRIRSGLTKLRQALTGTLGSP